MGTVIHLKPRYKGKRGNEALAKLEAEDPSMVDHLQRSLAIWEGDYSHFLDDYRNAARGIRQCRNAVKSGLKRNGQPYKESYLRELQRGTTIVRLVEMKPEIHMLARLGFYRKPMGEAAQALMARAQKDRESIDRLGHFLELLETLADRYAEED